MVKKLAFIGGWFTSAIILLIINMSLLGLTARQKSEADDVVLHTPIPVIQTYPAVASAGTGMILGAQIISGDSRALLLQSFLSEHESPLAPYANLMVSQADQYGFDFRLPVAIAMCESNLGKRMPSTGSYNAWGIAVYTGQLEGASFRDWPEAITWVSRYIKERYYDNGIYDLREIGSIWAPPSVETEYSWTNCVETFLGSIL
jgi:hypothetical protein